uniref:Uncharacterized protein n=1 Tax=Ananas comosus var. bracteatus TaxID=296719 RepID=A0A6V7P767_ANACO|nr:unnamed protein product [Ananas comosus var. bracteatus]
MKSPLLKLPFSRHRHSPQSFPKFVLLVVLILVFFTKITLYDALVASSAGAADEDAAAYFVNLTECDIFRGNGSGIRRCRTTQTRIVSPSKSIRTASSTGGRTSAS